MRSFMFSPFSQAVANFGFRTSGQQLLRSQHVRTHLEDTWVVCIAGTLRHVMKDRKV